MMTVDVKANTRVGHLRRDSDQCKQKRGWCKQKKRAVVEKDEQSKKYFNNE